MIALLAAEAMGKTPDLGGIIQAILAAVVALGGGSLLLLREKRRRIGSESSVDEARAEDTIATRAMDIAQHAELRARAAEESVDELRRVYGRRLQQLEGVIDQQNQVLREKGWPVIPIPPWDGVDRRAAERPPEQSQ